MAVVPYVRATHSDGQSWSAAKANLLEAGVNDVSYAPCVRVYHNTTQSITDATLTTLAFNSERFDQAGNAADTMHDTVTNNSRLTCKYAGVYLIIVNIEWASVSAGNQQLFIRHQGATNIAKTQVIADGRAQQASTLYALAVNEYVEARVQQNTGGPINVNSTGNYSPEFMMVRVG